MRRALLACVAAVLLGAVGALSIWGWIQWQYDRLVETDVASVPHAPVAIVFGAGISQSGQLSPMLRDRVDAAIALYRAGVVRTLLMSGDNRFVDYDEPGRMYDYAVARGIPAGNVVRDYAGRRTYDTCYRAKAIFAVTKAVLVSQRFHLARALFTCRELGVESTGFSADAHVYGSNSYYQMREGFASVAAWWDVKVARPLPVLGKPEPIVQ